MHLSAEIARAVTVALEEDIGAGDLSATLISPEKSGHASVLSRESAVLCGSAWFEAVFRRLDPQIRIGWQAKDVISSNRIRPLSSWTVMRAPYLAASASP
jgi:nicotinate-nucleotide pyrophosphorylase (carboxylating)